MSSILFLAIYSNAQEIGEIEVGHWIEARGELNASGDFIASSVELLEPEENEYLVGVVARFDQSAGWIDVLGQRASLSDRTEFRGTNQNDLLGQRVKVEGHYRGLKKFSARTISARGEGRDRIAGRVDALRHNSGTIEFDVMRYRVLLAPDVSYERKDELATFPKIAARAPARLEALANARGVTDRDDDDYLPGSIRLGETIRLGLQAEARETTERDYDLDGATAEDREDFNLSVRGALVWVPSKKFYARAAGSHSVLWRDDEKDGSSRDSHTRLTEAYGYWTNAFGVPLDLQVGRQDFYVDREWLWDENLDAVRLHSGYGNWHIELAAATILDDGSPREESTDRFIAYLTREVNDTLLGAYVVDQRTRLNGRDYPIHFGLRALGEWLPDNDSWAELALVRGYQNQVDISGWGFDLGTTWKPSALDPWYASLGYAFGSGDGNASDDVDHAFRQTGIQDNNGKLGGVTSFKYYGELLEPELSNMHILTLGVGRRFGKRTSLDLVYHKYRQDRAFDRLRDTALDLRPNGRSVDLGQELDLVFGHRAEFGLDTEIVLGTFDPGSGFDDARRAYLVKLQFRFRY